MIRGLAMMLCIVPSVNMALSSFAPTEIGDASGVFNLMRNLGGAVGIATVNTLLTDHTRIAVERLGEALTANGDTAQRIVAGLTERLLTLTPDTAKAGLMVQGLMARLAGREALTLAFDDVFRLMTWMFLGALIIVPFCRMPRASAAQTSAAKEAAH
jgi:DHA2 family multidrug resistance protein